MKKYVISGIIAVVVLAAGILLFYNQKGDSKSGISIKVDDPQNDIFVSSFFKDIKEIKDPQTRMATSDEDYIRQIADLLSQLKLECTGKINTEEEVVYGGWNPVEFEYNNSDKTVIVSLGQKNRFRYGENDYIIKNDNSQELVERYIRLMHNVNEDIGRKDENWY